MFFMRGNIFGFHSIFGALLRHLPQVAGEIRIVRVLRQPGHIRKESTSMNFNDFMAAGNRALQTASGPIAYNMTNDYMFRAVLQSDNKALRGLVCALLHLTQQEVESVEITNPVILGGGC